MSQLLLKYLDHDLGQDKLFLSLDRRVYTGDLKDIEVPETFSLRLHSPIIDGQIIVDGEVFVE